MDEDNSSKNGSNSDYLKLIVFFVLLLIAGVASVHWFPQAILTAFACGIIAALITHRFLGGFSKEDTFQATDIKFSGPIAALMGVTTIINIALSLQIDRWSRDWKLEVSPTDYKQLLVLDGNGKLTNLVASIANRVSETASISPSDKQLDAFVEACLTKPGGCLPQYKPVKIEVDNELHEGEAKVCANQEKYTGFPISLKKGNYNFLKVTIQNDPADCSVNSGNSNAMSIVYIGCIDNKKLRKVETNDPTEYQLGPFKKPSMERKKSRTTTC